MQAVPIPAVPREQWRVIGHLHIMRSNVCCASTEALRGHPELTENGIPFLSAVNKVTGELRGTVETPVRHRSIRHDDIL